MAWIALALFLGPALVRLTRDARRELWIPAAILTGALAVRLALPWGPLNFVDAERLGPLWEMDSFLDPLFASVPSGLWLLRAIGVSPDLLMHGWGPVVGALATVATYAAARALGAPRAAAALAGVIVATWPAHVHFSTGPMFSVEGGALGMALLAVAASPALGIFAVPLLGALLTLTVHARPECRLFVVPAVLLLLGPGWSWRSRAMAAAAMLAGIADYIPAALTTHGWQVPAEGCTQRFLESIVHNPLTFGLPWFALAVLGVVFGAGTWRSRLALAFVVFVFAGVYLSQGTDPSPQWGQWRYWTTLIPAVGVAVGLLIGRLKPEAIRISAIAAGMAVAVAALPLAWPTLRTPNNEQAAFNFVRETAAGAIQRNEVILVLRSPDAGAPQSSALLGLGAAFGPFEGIRWRCTDPVPPKPALKVTVLDPAAVSCAGWIPDGSILFLGIERTDPVLDELRQRYALEPIVERAVPVVADMPRINPNGRCSGAGGLIGPTYDAHFGWYRLRLRS